MAYPGKEIQSPDTRLVFEKTAADTDGELLQFEQFVQKDHAPIPAHVHGLQEERFTVLSGKMGVRAAGRESVLGPGGQVSVPAGTPHTFWNASESGEELHHRVELRPALNTERFFETVFGLERAGKLLPGKPTAALRMAPLALEHEFWVAGPPVPLQKALFRLLALLARLFGYQASYPEYSDDEARKAEKLERTSA